MKRKIPLIIGTVGVMLALAACSGASPSGQSGGKVTLTVWTGFTGGDRPGYAQIVKDFNASQSKIKVVMDVEPGTPSSRSSHRRGSPVRAPTWRLRAATRT